MNILIIKMLKVLGWQKLIKLTWRAVKPELEKQAKKTETQIDDELIKVVDEIINTDFSNAVKA